MIYLVQIFLASLIAIAGFVAWVASTTPSIDKIKGCLVTHHYKVSLCPKDASYTRLDNISPYLKNLVVIAEDASFYSHKGFDLDELKKSAQLNFDSMRFLRGGSTITQQLAKNIYLDFDKSIARKIREALLAWQIEKVLTKNEILEKYLNVVELGPNIFGVAKASNYYFSKAPLELNTLESAFLVYLLPNPKVHSRTFTKGTLTPYARYRILDLNYKLFKYKKISEEQYLFAKDSVDQFPWREVGNMPTYTDAYSDDTVIEATEAEGAATAPEAVEPGPEEGPDVEVEDVTEPEVQVVPDIEDTPEIIPEEETATEQPFEG
jgi:monofunctional biosynthetic peptidoglycan transglycosylase